jgi:glucose-6-phosphate 1-dehydrogenase
VGDPAWGSRRIQVRSRTPRAISVTPKTNAYLDHYLGKETVQNIMVIRFGNGIFEPIWNRRYIDHVQITVAELVGVERRGRYYDHTGALRDMIPNHLVQLLALTAMEPPSSFSAAALQNEQVKALESAPPIHPDECAACGRPRTVHGRNRGRSRRSRISR